jgi:CubicO group peptidase (beta-lactamase class C family)
MTLEDVLTMRTGLDYLESSGDQEEVKASKDWLQAILDRPMIGEPGTGWNYCAACSHILMKIVEQASGMNPREFADKYLFEPTGMKVGRWMADPQGVPYGAGGMTITPREAANLGYLFLNEGQWDGNQVISPEWIAASTSKHADIDVNAHFEYGYHWFTMPEFKGYAALGTGGQIILVIPEKALVIMTTADTEESLFELIGKYILPAVQ